MTSQEYHNILSVQEKTNRNCLVSSAGTVFTLSTKLLEHFIKVNNKQQRKRKKDDNKCDSTAFIKQTVMTIKHVIVLHSASLIKQQGQ